MIDRICYSTDSTKNRMSLRQTFCVIIDRQLYDFIGGSANTRNFNELRFMRMRQTMINIDTYPFLLQHKIFFKTLKISLRSKIPLFSFFFQNSIFKKFQMSLFLDSVRNE